jgi:hypothetical protein
MKICCRSGTPGVALNLPSAVRGEARTTDSSVPRLIYPAISSKLDKVNKFYSWMYLKYNIRPYGNASHALTEGLRAGRVNSTSWPSELSVVGKLPGEVS